MTAGDVVQALRDQNVQVSGGSIGAPPNADGNAFQYTVTTQGRFDDARAVPLRHRQVDARTAA